MSSANAQFGNQRNRSAGSMPLAGGEAWPWRLALFLALAACTSTSGCARRAYNDVYVENMAAEIRDLEDQLYEFDGEYRVMEQQLEALRTENARLRSAAPAPKNRTLRGEIAPSPSDGSGSEFFVPRTGNPSEKPAVPNKTTPAPAPSLELGPSTQSGSTSPKFSPPNAPPSNNQPSVSPPPTLTPAPLPPPKPVPGADQFNPTDLSPPSIEKGEPMPPAFPPIGTNPAGPVTMQTDNDLEVELGQIKLPAQLASAKLNDEPDDSIVRAAQIHPAATLPKDTRIVDVKFHPALCRAVNSNQQGDDDGLYLVLQPFNSAGEFVALPADLMIVALDLSREEKQATIGRWTLSAADVKAKMNPIGSSQGIHLSLSFSGAAPQCDRVVVFAYYTLADGRRLPAETEIMLNNMHRQSAEWIPVGRGQVRTVSHEERR